MDANGLPHFVDEPNATCVDIKIVPSTPENASARTRVTDTIVESVQLNV
jgi:hypothetical protein